MLAALLSWAWNFGDGQTLNTVENPCHVYANPGTYSVSLTVSNSAGCSATVTQPAIVSGDVILNYSLDTIICPGVQHCVTNNSTGVDLTYAWSMPGANPDTSNAASPCFVYNTAGTYTIILYLSSNNQCQVTKSYTIHVGAPVPGGFVSTDLVPCPNPPLFIDFTDTSLYVDSSWTWNFGDGTYTHETNTTHYYSIPGVYVVTDTVCNLDGCCAGTIIDTIIVGGPFGALSVNPGAVCTCRDSVLYSVSTYFADHLIWLYGCNATEVPDTIIPVGTPQNPTTVPYLKLFILR